MLSIYGMFYVGMGDAVSAEKVLTQAHSLAPNKQLISFDLIRAYLFQQKYKEAYALAKETFDNAPMYPEAQRWLMLTSVYVKDFKNARMYMAAAGYAAPFDGDVLNALVSTGQTGLAIEALNELKKTNPELSPQIDAYMKTLLGGQK
jgi:tetratricopeptide (TPR) repeat protein